MYEKLRFLLAIFCFVEIVRYGSTQTTSDQLFTGSTVAMTTDANVAPWNVTCNQTKGNETYCVYNLRAPGNDPSELSNITISLNNDNRTLSISQGQYNTVKEKADSFTTTLGRLINQLKDMKGNLTELLKTTQAKLKNATDDLKKIQDRKIYDAEVSLCAVSNLNQCYINAQCNATCPGNTTVAPTTIAPTTIAPTTIAPTTAAVSTAVSQTVSVAQGSTGSTVSVSMGTGSSGTIGTTTSAATNTPFTGSSTPTTSATTVSGGTTAQRSSAATVRSTSAASVQTTSAGTGTTISTTTITGASTSTSATTPSGPTTTTLTPRPTPQNPCANKTCNALPGYPGTCESAGSIARCSCPGDLDPDSCGKVGCVSKSNGGLDVTRIGPFWSPGMTSETGGTYPANSEGCLWKMSAPPGLNINVTAIHFITEECTTLVMNTNTGNVREFRGNLTDYLGMMNQRLQSALAGADTATFEFKSCQNGTSADYYFNLKFDFIPPTSPPPEEE